MGRTPCCDKNGLKKGPWTPEEDEKLIEYIKTFGPSNWRTLPKNAGLQRCGKSCRLRWANYLRPDIKRGRFSFEEEETIIQLHSILGNKWSAIAARLPGRTDNEIKNYWNTHIRKRLLRMGIDPVTHSPHLDLLDLASLLNSAQRNITNLLGLQTLANPEAVRLLATLIASSGNENPENLLQKLQQNQLLNAQMQNQPPIYQPTQFQNPIQQFPSCTTSNPSSSSLNQTVPVQDSLEQFFMNSTDTTGQPFQQNLTSSIEGLASLLNYGCSTSDHNGTDVSENSAFQSLNNSSSQHFSFDSVLSMPLSSPAPLNSSSTFINTEDERESNCSNMMKFEIPESFDFDSLM